MSKNNENQEFTPEQIKLLKHAHAVGFLTTLVKAAGVEKQAAIQIFKEADQIAEQQNQAFEKKAGVLLQFRDRVLTAFNRQPA